VAYQPEQEYEDYKSKYLDLYAKVSRKAERVCWYVLLWDTVNRYSEAKPFIIT